jgi:predicted Zn-ribbon and HTH transcriptional regulator
LKNRPKEPATPAERTETLRRRIQAFLEGLEGRTASARDISQEVGIPERDAYEHLAHIGKSVQKTGRALVVTPAECRKCGFSFRKRERLKKPGRCPVCRSETITDPLFSIR